MSKEELQNTGFLPPVLSEKDWIFGGTSGIIHEDRLTTGDWRPFVPTGEVQRYKNFDDFSCTEHSTENSLETQGRMLTKSNLFRGDDIWWLKENGYVVDGNWNFDDRWLALEAGNVRGRGNNMNAPWQTLYEKGLPSQGPAYDDLTEDQFYTKDLPASSYALALEWKTRFTVKYERIDYITDSELRKALKHAPIQVAVATCAGWFGDQVVHTCPAGANHAVLLVHLEDNGTRWIYDSYLPFLKKLEPGYPLQYAYKGVLSPITNVDGEKKTKHLFQKNLQFGDYDNEVVFLGQRLIEEGCMIDKSYIPTPLYSIETREAVFEYQKRNSILSPLDIVAWWRGRYCGKRTRAKLNG